MEGKLIKEEEEYYALYTNKGIFVSDVYGGSLGNRLSLKNCQEIENGYDLDELALDYYKLVFGNTKSYKDGFQKAIELLGDKKFSEEDMIKCFNASMNEGWVRSDFYIQSLQQTEWDVEVEMEEVLNMDYKPSFGGGSDSHYNPMYVSQPKLDAENCLILKRK